jgi:hypothetical protein
MQPLATKDFVLQGAYPTESRSKKVTVVVCPMHSGPLSLSSEALRPWRKFSISSPRLDCWSSRSSSAMKMGYSRDSFYRFSSSGAFDSHVSKGRTVPDCHPDGSVSERQQVYAQKLAGPT